MSIAAVGDPHIWNFSRFGSEKRCGVNRRGRMTLDTLRLALEKVVEARCREAVIVGDLLDAMNPGPQLLWELRRILDGSGVRIHIIRGNHDCQSDLPGDDALHVLQSDSVRVYDAPTAVLDHDNERTLIFMPFQSGRIASWLPVELEKLVGDGTLPYDTDGYTRLLYLHAGVKDRYTAPWLQDSTSAIRLDTLQELTQRFSIHDVFTGDWHEHKIWRGNDSLPTADVHQVGALCPVGFQNVGVTEYGNVAVFNLFKEVSYISVPGPRFIQFGPDGDPSGLQEDGNSYFIEWVVRFEDFDTAQEKMRDLIASGRIVDGDVLVSETVSVREATEAAIGSSSIPEAAGKAVEALILNGVDKSSVLLRTLKYLGV